MKEETYEEGQVLNAAENSQDASELARMYYDIGIRISKSRTYGFSSSIENAFNHAVVYQDCAARSAATYRKMRDYYQHQLFVRVYERQQERLKKCSAT